MTKGLVIVTLFVVSIATSAQTKSRICEGFLPPNKMFYPESPTAGGITHKEFDRVLDEVQQVFAPIIQQKGGTLQIERLWSDGTVNAYADRNGSNWIIEMYGGFARHPAVTADGFMAVACHELGHHLGESPHFSGDWAAVEGQSDYFSTLKCLRRMWDGQDNKKILDGMTLDPAAVSECKAQHNSQQDELICIRSVMAGMSLAAVLAEGEPTQPSLTTPDKSQVNKTFGGHPEGQCRLDTLFEGALCTVPYAHDLDYNDYKVGACFTPNNSRGFRPRCWFMPN